MEYIGRRVRIREDLERFPEKILMEALHRAIPVEAIESALRLTDSFEKRRRCLPARLVVLFVIAMKMSNFKRKRPEHFKPPKPSKDFAQAIVML